MKLPPLKPETRNMNLKLIKGRIMLPAILAVAAPHTGRLSGVKRCMSGSFKFHASCFRLRQRSAPCPFRLGT